jgi:hypothetical protein
MAWQLWAGVAAAAAGVGYLLWPSGSKRPHGDHGDHDADGKTQPPHGDHDADGKTQPPDQGDGSTTAAPESSAETSTSAVEVPGSPAPNTPASSGFHPGPFILPQAAAAVASNGRARFSAQALYKYLSSFGTAPNEALHRLTLEFQRAHNTDPLAIRLAGRLPRTGFYDPRTSATLTMYTGHAIPASPSAPRAPVPHFRHVMNPNIPGNAAMSGWNLAVDLRRRGMVEDERQRELVRQYQRDINRDPKFPGPAWARGTRPAFPSRIRENGRYNVDVSRALRIQTHNAPPPPRHV